ncbi:uncharacterized protein N7459_008686 [Penicillium hispanicum]|uniref:uncharacterized protein n=1 Tax=Penicillium hispanicum TaxID=1080232 RepID=UPI002540B138|nr:uncharacterized protein N7459_008686 [Penicillium hispanicum]KAJ5574259.1 hypothetical protein N7459_008686 [Penicillium hispanicum]
MQFKNSMLLMTALTAGSAVARLHGHERRHAHPKPEAEAEVEAPATTAAPALDVDVDKRAVGDVVYATIDGVLQSWINDWYGESASSTSSSTTLVVEAPPTTTPEPVPEPTSTPSAVESEVSATPAPSAGTGSGGAWTNYPSDGQFSQSGFGGSNYKPGSLGIGWQGNTGLPWGSNIIQVSEADANQYRNILRFEGSKTDDWTVIFWNKMSPSGELNGFFTPHKALTFTLTPNEVAYVAIDDQSTGGWAAYKGDKVPLSQWGSYSATWGEFTMRPAPETSSWDVSCIQAQLAGLEVQGMSICTHDKAHCSSITTGAGQVSNAYTSALAHIDGIGGNIQDKAVRLLVNLDYAG